MLFHNEVFQPLEAGMHLSAFVKQVRPDGKIDLELQKAGARKVDDFPRYCFSTSRIMTALPR